ncbi:hypothetical protein UFOVP708_66 [uncultured Caudovirales phage]|uniref:Uncharacterized protein n=1 Tax=uncultured Caudovirales phage TaxID=2100421 RepID=A0A6J5NQD4_9CAUD|nr:hypothetical protein UFOVP708_66 [uncultured Caudovirales phage]
MSTKRYISTQPHAVLFDIMVSGENIYGQRIADNLVEFLVPEALAERFEMHWHFTSGNLVAAEEGEAPAETAVKKSAKKTPAV